MIALATVLAAVLMGLGNTVGYHRLLTHRSFKARPPLRWVLTLLGALHGGSPVLWVGLHRLHHARSDTDSDPHSPIRGFWWAHCGWLIGTERALPALLFALSGFGQQLTILLHDVRRLLGRNPPTWRELCPDLMGEPLMRFLDAPGVMPVLFVVQLGAAWGLAGWTGIGALWLVHLWLTNTSWAVNSVAHTARFGRRTFETREDSVDVPWLAVLTHGEGYHNGHHRYPRSARHALHGGADLSWAVIRLLSATGLAQDVWLPKKFR
ncbi:MAG: acyl-CoA desaturase [Myxococcota bacterium]|nr:acyl-CoA desaturase [Myxococcota bacterium]